VLKEHGVSAVPDLAGAGICEEHLRHLSDADRLIVLRGFRDDDDPKLERWRQLRFLDAGRVNRYLSNATSAAPRRHQFTAAEIAALSRPLNGPEEDLDQ
jgi:hypothetical protein